MPCNAFKIIWGISFSGNTAVPERGRAAIGAISTSGSSAMDLVFMTRNAGDGSQLGSADERMRITSGGDVWISTTSGAEANEGLWLYAQGIYLSKRAGTGLGTHCIFQNNAAVTPTTVGTITSSGSSTSYNTSSDYRLKENVVEMTGALDRVSQLKPSRFNFIADADKTVDGFLAHEVQEIVPEAITGQKDAVDEDGNPEYQGIDQSKLVPLLVAAIQELEARIKELENK